MSGRTLQIRRRVKVVLFSVLLGAIISVGTFVPVEASGSGGHVHPYSCANRC
jgi:hypothetical protein